MANSNTKGGFSSVLFIIVILLLGGWFFYKSNNKAEAPIILEDNIGEGLEQDLAPIASQNIIGKWQSINDAKFVREFKADGVVIDNYGSEFTLTDKWKVFTKNSGLETSFPLEDDTAYLEFSNGQESMYFKITKVTPEELELIYMDRGSILRFKKVQ